MNQNFTHNPHALTKANKLPVTRERVEEMLHEIAFVLKMTEKVRAEIEADQEVEEFAMA